MFGAGNETRTRDLNLGKVALYQLSYSRIDWRRVPESNRAKRICNPLHNRFANAPLNFLSSACRNGKLLLPVSGFGAGKESRTLDLNLGKVALYQLSYARAVLRSCYGAPTGSRTPLSTLKEWRPNR